MSWTDDVRASLRELDASPRRLRSFAFTVGAVLLALALWLAFRGRAPGFRWAAGASGAALVLSGLVAPSRLAAVHRAWMALAFTLAWFVSRLLLAAVFLLLVTPIALLGRLVGKRFLETRPDPGATSYWIRRDAGRRDDHRKMY
jgi:hypothetical protein